MQTRMIANPISRVDLRNYTQDIRKRMGWEDSLYFPIVEFLELFVCNPKYFDFELSTPDLSEMPVNAGETDLISKTIRIREDVYLGASYNNGRDRFTVAHEIGHALLHYGQLKLARVDPNVTIKTYCDPEWQANAFAGELLIPHYLISNLSIEEIKRYCCVSYEAAEIQKRK